MSVNATAKLLNRRLSQGATPFCTDAREKIGSGPRLTSAIVFLGLMAICLTSIAKPLPDQVLNSVQLKQVGEGAMTWFGITIYKASLWTASGTFESYENNLPLALHITYEKNIKSKELVNATLEQWQRMGFFDSESRVNWGRKLENIWPDVKPGDSITTLVDPNRNTLFFANNKLLGQISDPAFSFALISIWLHPNTDEPDLREKLIRAGV